MCNDLDLGLEVNKAIEETKIDPSVQAALITQVSDLLSIDREKASHIVSEAERLYKNRMQERFSELKVRERLKRTNPFLVSIRSVRSVSEWASFQIQSALFASEEEAVGHLLEMIAKNCHPNATPPELPDDFDYQVVSANKISAYQVKMSWDCMPMSTRKNLSNTIFNLTEHYATMGRQFEGIFAPCYGKATTTMPKGQKYISMRSREFWQRVGNGDTDYDVKVGEVCGMLCSEFRCEVQEKLIPQLIADLTNAAIPIIGNPDGTLSYRKLFRAINI
ncbi:PmeII family type II restriction endonuclease [Skermanella stibiiresistens]|uniref:PmeII family type II restriction endonuclease n=1 Tax=Skermanella stibiiresistens TaxID=913326 RepID=UPI0018DB9731|nr:PmeII family type II restriction endonuclease [Skermanella stibiiresistens]